MDIRPISVVEQLPRVSALLREHWAELALNKSLMVLSPNVEVYATLEAAGSIVALGAFDGEELIGYSVNLLTRHLHYSGLLTASNDVLFVRQDHRGRVGPRLIRKTEKACNAAGAQILLWHAKPGTLLEQLLPRIGYGVQDIVYSRVLAQRTTQSDKEAGA